MSNRIAEAILNRKMETFAGTFVEDAQSIFFKEDQLFHPGEYGRYRENALKDLLRFLIPSAFRVSDGFIITGDSSDDVSKQCDIIIYDGYDMPLLANDLSFFFTIESVVGIGEVKSILSLSEFKNTLIKLANNKMLSKHIHGLPKVSRNIYEEGKQPISFLVCKKLNFKLSSINFDEIYEGIERKYWHNCILSIEDCLLSYRFYQNGKIVAYPFPYMVNSEDSRLGEPSLILLDHDRKLHHIKYFLTLLTQATSFKTLFETELLHYLDLPKVNLFGID